MGPVLLTSVSCIALSNRSICLCNQSIGQSEWSLLLLIVLIIAAKFLIGFIRVWNLSDFKLILFCSSTVQEGQVLPSCSPPLIPVLCYLSPINNSHLSYVILYIIFSSNLGSPLRISSSTHGKYEGESHSSEKF